MSKQTLRTISVLAVVGGIAIWWLLSASGLVVIPGPVAVAAKAVEMTQSGV
ncbi:MAG: hypothetical protein L0H47_09400 [Micrococcaceae bacterium]|nr:hypothetical protein [Micrococcaceae bacterium]